MLDKLEGAIKLILAPSSHPAPYTSTVTELVVKLVVTRWQASSVHIRTVQVDIPVNIEDGNIVIKSARVELVVFKQSCDCVLLMLNFLWVIESTGIIFPNPHL